MTQHGVFNSFWDNKSPHHLPFLSFHEVKDESPDWNLTISLNRLYNILDSNKEVDIHEGIKLLLQDGNWRANLLACMGVLAIEPSKRGGLINLFWDRVLKGSWVCPQMLVVLFLIDKDFALSAKLLSGSSNKAVKPLKSKAATEYLLTGVVNDTEQSDLGATITKDWQFGLNELIAQGKIRALS